MSELLYSGQVGQLIWSKPFILSKKRKILKVKEWLKQKNAVPIPHRIFKEDLNAYHSIDAEKELTDMINGLDIKSVEVTGEVKKIKINRGNS